MSTTLCNRCQNQKATKTIAWTQMLHAPDDSPDDMYAVAHSATYCDECAELELADRHRDRPRVEAIA